MRGTKVWEQVIEWVIPCLEIGLGGSCPNWSFFIATEESVAGAHGLPLMKRNKCYSDSLGMDEKQIN